MTATYENLCKTKIVLYGCGTQNFYLVWCRLKWAEIPVEFAVDKNEELWGKRMYNDTQIFSPGKLRDFDSKSAEPYFLVITVRNQKIIEEIKSGIADLKNAIIYTQDQFTVDSKLGYHKKNMSLVLYHAANHCNLNCVRCSHASPLCQTKFLCEDTLRNDLQHLKSLGIDIFLFEFGGGEPLLNQKLYKLLYIVKEYYPHVYISILTNGTLLDNVDERFVKACIDNDVEIAVTYYPIKIPHAEIVKRARERGLHVTYGNPGDAETGSKGMWRTPLRLHGGMDGAYSYEHCDIPCFLIEDGIVYHCCNSMIGSYLNSYFHISLPEKKAAGVCIYDYNNKDELLSALSKPCGMCYHCDIDYKNELIEWTTTKRTIDEWVIDAKEAI